MKGMEAFEKTITYLKEKYPNHFIIADAKRGDIGNTSKMYAQTFFKEYNVDALTIAPYMGEDSVKPFLEYEGKWVILLALTSNKGVHFFILSNTCKKISLKKSLKNLTIFNFGDTIYIILFLSNSYQECSMFAFNYAAGASAGAVIAVWVLVLVSLYVLNEISRRSKLTGFLCFFVLPVVLSVLWFTVLRDKTYLDWFHLVKVYSSTAGCIGFWCIRFVRGKDKAGKEWKLSENKWALCFPPLILTINILEAVARDFQVGSQYSIASKI